MEEDDRGYCTDVEFDIWAGYDVDADRIVIHQQLYDVCFGYAFNDEEYARSVCCMLGHSLSATALPPSRRRRQANAMSAWLASGRSCGPAQGRDMR